MKTYELTYIISPEITSEEAEAKRKEIESAIGSREGTIVRQANPIARTLAYPIKKHASGFVGFLEFQLEQEKLVGLKEVLAKDGKIVRHMLIIKEAAELKKERRTRTKPIPAFGIEPKIKEPASVKDFGEAKEEKPAKSAATKEKEKVELKDIEQKLEELLND